MRIIDTIVHKWLRIPYSLYVREVRHTNKTSPTVLLIHGLGATGEMWQPVISGIPRNINVIAIDLLGFGNSPRPEWERYDVKLQARTLQATLTRLGIKGPLMIVGHSLGSLIAIEVAKSYPGLVGSLVLCSPPLYRNEDEVPSVSPDRLLRRVYRRLLRSPKTIIKIYNLGRATRIDPSLQVNDNNIGVFASTAEASIINQTAIDDIAQLTLPIDILHGILDPVVIPSILTKLAKTMPNVTFGTVRASHALNGPYIAKIVDTIKTRLRP